MCNQVKVLRNENNFIKEPNKVILAPMDYEHVSAEFNDFLIQQKTYISIIPLFDMDMLKFISGDFGPFKVNNRVQVPLWVAVYLKKLNKCRIYAPNWLTLDYLKGIKESEVSNKELTQMPEYYYEIAQILLFNASDDITGESQMKTLLEDINQLRDNKIETILKDYLDKQKFGNTLTMLQINNISSHEINKNRRLLSTCLIPVNEINQLLIQSDKTGQSQSQR